MKPKPTAPVLKDQFAQAKALIQRKQYDEARALLRTIDHPTVQEWLAKLDEIAPQKPGRSGTVKRVAALLLVVVAGIAVFMAYRNYTQTVGTAQKSASQQLAPLFVAATATTVAAAATLAPSPTITETPTVRLTDDIEAMAAAGEAAINPLREPLEQFPDFQGIRLLSAIMLDNGVSINIDADVAPADDNEDTMGRVLALAQEHVDPISQIRVNAYNADQLNSLWLWEAGQWTVTRLAAAAPVVTARDTQPPVSRPGNCATAVAAGFSPEQAAQWDHLDRDGDGVACYGD